MLKQLALIFGSYSKAQEILFLQQEMKPVVRQGFYEHELPKVEQFCTDNNLFIVKSNFKVLLADDTSFSNKGIRIPIKDPRPGMFFIYLSKDEKKAWTASYYELMNNSRDLGTVLGYPPCCVDFFCRRFSANNPNLQLTPTNPFTNISKRDLDCALISHFPCNSNCTESIQLGQKYFRKIAEFDRERAEEMKKLL